MADVSGIVNDELVSQFMSITGSADAGRATSYLEMSGGNLETAVSLYMDHAQGGGGGGGGGGIGGGMGAAMAGVGDFSSGGLMDDAEIRAPDETRSMRLMDDNMLHHDPSFQMMHAMMEEQLAQSAFAAHNTLQDVRAAVNAAAESTDESKDEMDTDDEDNEVEVLQMQPPRLSNMFAAPTHLIYKAGGFQGARAMAKDSRRWLLVNIQRDSEFASHALNRDVWRDELVENLIREGFIFWQQVRCRSSRPTIPFLPTSCGIRAYLY